MIAGQQTPAALSTLLQLEGQARAAHTLKELQFLAVNETGRLIKYRQAFLLKAGRTPKAPYQVETASSVAVVERDAPMIRWLERMMQAVRTKYQEDSPVRIDEADCPKSLQDGWKEFSSAHALWCPLRHPDKSVLGGLWFDREFPWQDNELLIVQRLAETYAHAWKALDSPKLSWRKKLPRGTVWVVAVAVVALLWLPVHLSALAPAKVIAKDPTVVSAPMDGVIGEILVPPNATVTEGQTIIRYEDTNLRNQYEVAEKQLAVGRAEHHQAIQSGFLDAQRKADVPLREAEAHLRATERNYAKELLGQVEVKALTSGLLLYSDKADWIGRPVVVGERIMEIANPNYLEVRIDLPVSDAILLNEGAEVQVFLDAKPLKTFTATVTHASYHAEVLPGDVLAYRVTAEFTPPTPQVRIGWQGTAKVYGEKRPLAFLLFRRPIAALRQFMGL